MKKTIIKISVFAVTFVLALFIVGSIMNKGHDNLTMEMASATFPVVSMEKNGYEYNMLYGYREAMDTAFQRDTITVLGENRNTNIVIDTYGRHISEIAIEVRSADGSRLIENTPITGYEEQEDQIRAAITLKDLIEKDTEYSLAILLRTDEGDTIYYYTRVVWSDSMHTDEKIAFVKDFHEKLYDKAAAKELTRYLETNSQLEDNKSFHKVNIHSSFQQITWGELAVEETEAPIIQLTDIASQTASVLLKYQVATTDGKQQTHYQVEEHYRVRYTSERMYLLDYERTMTQIPDVKKIYANDKILLGITAADIPMVESEDGNVVVFEVANRLCSYNVTTNKITVIFSFADDENNDVRTTNTQHAIKILDVTEGGNVNFAVYGYMNRGRHEGEVGIQIYFYDNTLNTIEESVYIPYQKTFAVLSVEIQQLLFLNRDQMLYLSMDNIVYEINLVEKTYKPLVDIRQDDSIRVSENNRILVWLEGENSYQCSTLNVENLNTGTQNIVQVQEDEAIRPLGFMGEDIIYGVAKTQDIVEENSGRIFFPMYKVCICNSAGELLKEYRQDGIYITECVVVDNQITLQRVQRLETGEYQDITQDQIMNNTEQSTGKNVIVTADIDIYERYVQIQTRSAIDSKTIKILTPKEVVFEGGRELTLPDNEEIVRYYVYGPYGVSGIFTAPARAVNLAYEISGVVADDSGEVMWIRGNRVTRNQIMAIKEASVTEEKDSLAVCLDTMLKFEGIIRNSEYLLGQGQTVMEILQENLVDMQILDLTGCSLDAVLYYVNQDIPVLAMLENGEAVLVTGFNEFNLVLMEPSTGRLYKMGMNDATAMFAENGNCFITYTK